MKMKNENSPFQNKSSLRVKGKLMDLSTPKVMGIINLTPDSFYAESRVQQEKALKIRVEKMLKEEVDIVDLGGFSSRPGAELIDETEELQRLIPAIKCIVGDFPELIISVDTYRANVAEIAVDNGAAIINDISGGLYDERMFECIAKLKVPYVLMHLKGEPKNMQSQAEYDNVVTSVFHFFNQQITLLRDLNVSDVILDVGFGFAKDLSHNYQLLKNLAYFGALGCPLLVGLSRKKMIQKVIDVPIEDSLNGTTAAHMISLLNGASILRVHDVKEAKEVVKLFNYYQNQ